MTYFKIEKKRDFKYVGVSVPSHTHEFLTLYALAYKETKTGLIKPLVDTWIRDRKEEGVTEDEMTLSVIDLVQQRWAYEKVNNRKADSFIFKAKMKKELIKRGLSTKRIELIIKSI